MNLINLNQLIKEYGNKKHYKDDTFLFRDGDEDNNIYLIDEGSISLQKNGNDVFMLGEGQILGERTFITGDKKPIDAKVTSNSDIYCFSKESFEKLDLEIQKQFFSSLVVYLSERVNSLDTILGLLGVFNEVIIDMEASPSEKVLQFINHFFDVKSYLMMKYEDNSFRLFYGDMSFDEEIEKFVIGLMELNVEVKFGKNYLFVSRGDYIFLFSGEQKMEEYISANLIYYVRALMQFLGENIEKMKNDDLEKMCSL